MRQVAALALLATGRAFVLPANAPRTTTVQADMLEAPLDLVRSYQAEMIGQYLDDVVAEPAHLVRDHHAYMWEEFADQARTPLDLVSSFHEGLSREHARLNRRSSAAVGPRHLTTRRPTSPVHRA